MPPNKKVGPRAGHHSRHEGTDTYSTTSHHHATGYSQSKGLGAKGCSDTVPVQLQRRRLASWRCELLPGGYRDPHRPWRPEKLSEKQVAGAVAAVRHLRDAGLEPLFDLEMLRAMWRAGHHQLVDELREVR